MTVEKYFTVYVINKFRLVFSKYDLSFETLCRASIKNNFFLQVIQCAKINHIAIFVTANCVPHVKMSALIVSELHESCECIYDPIQHVHSMISGNTP